MQNRFPKCSSLKQHPLLSYSFCGSEIGQCPVLRLQSIGPSGLQLREELFLGSLRAVGRFRSLMSSFAQLLGAFLEAALQHGHWLSPEPMIQERGRERGITQDRNYHLYNLILERTAYQFCHFLFSSGLVTKSSSHSGRGN